MQDKSNRKVMTKHTQAREKWEEHILKDIEEISEELWDQAEGNYDKAHAIEFMSGVLHSHVMEDVKRGLQLQRDELRAKMDNFVTNNHDCEKGGCKELDFIYKILTSNKEYCTCGKNNLKSSRCLNCGKEAGVNKEGEGK